MDTWDDHERRRARDEGRLPKPRSKSKPERCPQCASTRVVPIVYGLPPTEQFRKAEAGLIALGGCEITDDDPRWKCLDCREEIWEKQS